MKLPLILIGLVFSPLGAVAQAQNPTPPDHFVDVPKDHWAYEAVESLRSKGILVGYPDYNYRGKRTMTRYELSAGLERAFKLLPTMPAQKGPTGEKGERGPKGEPGPAGLPGVVPEGVIQLRKLMEALRDEAVRLEKELGSANTKLDSISKDAADIKSGPGNKH